MIYHIIVIDDKIQFPLYVWRYITRSIGFGIGLVGPDGQSIAGSSQEEDRQPNWISNGTSIFIHGWRARLHWVKAAKGWQDILNRICLQISTTDRVLAVVDVRGEFASDYSVDKAVRLVKDLLQTTIHEVVIVSAYQPSGQTVEDTYDILPKTRDTLRSIRLWLQREPKPCVSPKNSKRQKRSRHHILVTGAGFEIRNHRNGLGMPVTKSLLEEMDPTPFREAGIELRPQVDSFPVPGEIRSPLLAKWRQKLAAAALEKDLDQYWNFLLGEGQLQQAVLASVNLEEIVFRERAMREAFRRSLQRYDWGNTNQSLQAASIRWHTWLTTNYTHFANRGISHVEARSYPQGHHPWRVVSIASEAHLAMREDPGEGASTTSDPSDAFRYLFKLHGDIGHLNTMAIAGFDKERFTPLSMPVDNLYQLYLVAEFHLTRSLKRAIRQSSTGDSDVYWHIIGHGLYDQRLCELIKNVVYQVPCRHIIFLINREPALPEGRLRDTLRTNDNDIIVKRLQLDAASYMEELELSDLESIRTVDWLSKTFKNSR